MMDREKELIEFEFSKDVLSEKEVKEITKIQKEFLKSYADSKDKMTVEEWLPRELKKQLPERTNEEIQKMSNEITTSLKVTESKKDSLQQAISSGRSKESWLASDLAKYTSHMSAKESEEYLRNLDKAVADANREMSDAITTKIGNISQNPSLDGYIAEQHHANSYNMKAKSVGGQLHAEVLKPKAGEAYGKNSVDIVLKDNSGKIVSRYQVKYGATAKDTIRLINKGDYRGQQLLVPAEQVEAVQKAFPNRKVSSCIGDGDITSKPLTKEQAKTIQGKAQGGKALDVSWNEYAAKDIALGIGKQAGKACVQGAAVGAGLNIAAKVWNGEEIDGDEVIETAITTGADYGVKTATAGALKVAAEKEVIKALPKSTNALTNIAFVAVENVKVLGKVASGDLTVKEGIDKMQQTTVSCVAGMAASTKGSAIGATVGSVLGPVGTVVGGIVGGAVGYVAGSKVGETIVRGAQKVRDTIREKVGSFVESAVDTVKSTVSNIFSGIASFFGF